MNWHLQDAKNQFSKVVRKARTDGPQAVTVRGRPAAVVLSAEEYERLTGQRPSFAEHLLAMPELDDDIWDAVLSRPGDDARDVDLVMYLLDTNVISAGRKGHEAASRWIAARPDAELFLSVITIGEIVRGAEMKRREDRAAGARLDE